MILFVQHYFRLFISGVIKSIVWKQVYSIQPVHFYCFIFLISWISDRRCAIDTTYCFFPYLKDNEILFIICRIGVKWTKNIEENSENFAHSTAGNRYIGLIPTWSGLFYSHKVARNYHILDTVISVDLVQKTFNQSSQSQKILKIVQFYLLWC